MKAKSRHIILPAANAIVSVVTLTTALYFGKWYLRLSEDGHFEGLADICLRSVGILALSLGLQSSAVPLVAAWTRKPVGEDRAFDFACAILTTLQLILWMIAVWLAYQKPALDYQRA